MAIPDSNVCLLRAKISHRQKFKWLPKTMYPCISFISPPRSTLLPSPNLLCTQKGWLIRTPSMAFQLVWPMESHKKLRKRNEREAKVLISSTSSLWDCLRLTASLIKRSQVMVLITWSFSLLFSGRCSKMPCCFCPQYWTSQCSFLTQQLALL